MENAVDVKDADGLLIAGNEMSGFIENKTLVFQKGPANVEVRCNLMRDGFTGVEYRGESGGTLDGITFAQNVMVGFTEYALKFDGVSSADVLSNTFVDVSSDGLRIEGAGLAAGRVRNNLWLRTGALDAGTFEADHNGYFIRGASLRSRATSRRTSCSTPNTRSALAADDRCGRRRRPAFAGAARTSGVEAGCATCARARPVAPEERAGGGLPRRRRLRSVRRQHATVRTAPGSPQREPGAEDAAARAVCLPSPVVPAWMSSQSGVLKWMAVCREGKHGVVRGAPSGRRVGRRQKKARARRATSITSPLATLHR